MKLASRAADGPDGRLLLVSRDLSRGTEARAALTLQSALDDWEKVRPRLQEEARALADDPSAGEPLDAASLAAALPRAFQFLDGSAFLAHNHILAEAWGYPKRTPADPPLMYQGLSDRFYAAHADVPFRSEDDQIDLEAEYGVILSATPRGTGPEPALGHVALVVIVNDWSLRAFGPDEMRGGFGFLQAKPPSALSMVAITPDELGGAWRDGRVHLPMSIHRNGELFGRPHGGAMTYGFGELIAHACLTRDLCAGTVLGSGTVSNADAADVGSGCIAERRALDQIAGRPLTPFLSAGERVRLEVDALGGGSWFGRLDQRVVIPS